MTAFELGDDLSWDEALQVEIAAARFEAAWQRNEPIAIEDVLPHVPAQCRDELFRALLETELGYCQFRNELPAPHDYALRFPNRVDVIAQLFDDRNEPRPTAASAAPMFGLPLDVSLSPGQRFGRYLLDRELGRGSMGVVLRARDEVTGRFVAIKVLHRLGQMSPDVRKMMLEQFCVEVKTLARLDHSGIVDVVDTGEFDNTPYYTMPCLSGRTVRDLIKAGQTDPVVAARMIADVSRAVHAAHRAGVYHRDLKPGNLLLDDNGRVLVADFGTALTHDDFGTGMTIAGTPLYMSPEQARGESHLVDGRTDIFSLGIILYELLTGTHPFDSNHATHRDVIDRIRNLSAAPLRQRAEIPRRLENICLTALAKDIDQRYRTSEDLADALDAFIAHATSMDEAGSPDDAVVPDSLPGNSAVTAEHAEPVIVIPQWKRWGLPSAIALIVLIACVIGFEILAGRWLSSETQHPAMATTANHSETPDRATQAGSEGPASGSHTTASSALASVSESNRNQTTSSAADRTAADETVTETAERILSRLAIEAARPPTGESANPDGDSVWQDFTAARDASIRSLLIETVAAHGVNPRIVIERLQSEREPSIRQALLLALGQYEAGTLPDNERESLLPWLMDVFRSDPDPGVHSAVDWLVRHWGFDDELQTLRLVLQQIAIDESFGWHESQQGFTMAIVQGPQTFPMGSPDSETGRRTNEPLCSATIDYTFAIATKEVTQLQYKTVYDEFGRFEPPTDPAHPEHGMITWHDAVAWCQQLSHLEGIPRRLQCYEIDSQQDDKITWREKPNALELCGYRLPTDEEWEFACRSGTTTARHWGTIDSLAASYAWFDMSSGNTTQPVGLLKPNVLGIFDIHGNVSEYVHDVFIDGNRLNCRFRGGSAWSDFSLVRSAGRYVLPDHFTTIRMGFRVARTMPAFDSTSEQEPLQILVGPPVVHHRAADSERLVTGTDANRPAETDSVASEVDFHRNRGVDDIVTLGVAERGRVVPRTIRLLNSGPDPVELRDVEYDAGFVLMNVESCVIPAGGSRDLTIACNERMIGSRKSNVVLHVRNGSREIEQKFKVCGIVHGPRILMHAFGEESEGSRIPPTFNFGVVPRHADVRHAFTIRNRGSRPLVVSDLHLPEGFRLDGTFDATIPVHGGFSTFEIVADTSGPPRTGTVTFRTNDWVTPLFSFVIRAVPRQLERFSKIGVFRDGVWLIDSNRDSVPNETIRFGRAGDIPVTGDWNGDGTADLAVCRSNTDGRLEWHLRLRHEPTDADATQLGQAGDGEHPTTAERGESGATESFVWGQSGDIPLALDANLDGIDEPAVVRTSRRATHLLWLFDTNGNRLIDPETEEAVFGQPGATPLTGDWTGGGRSAQALAYAHPESRDLLQWEFRQPGGERELRQFGLFGDIPLLGDWDGDGRSQPCVVRLIGNQLVWLLDVNGDPQSEIEIRFGIPGDIPVVIPCGPVKEARTTDLR